MIISLVLSSGFLHDIFCHQKVFNSTYAGKHLKTSNKLTRWCFCIFLLLPYKTGERLDSDFDSYRSFHSRISFPKQKNPALNCPPCGWRWRSKIISQAESPAIKKATVLSDAPKNSPSEDRKKTTRKWQDRSFCSQNFRCVFFVNVSFFQYCKCCVVFLDYGVSNWIILIQELSLVLLFVYLSTYHLFN